MSIRRLKSIKNIGVFNSYTCDSSIGDLSELVIIYGWNYSGKTTLSRIFSWIEKKSIDSGFPNASFEFLTNDGRSITEKTLSTESLDIFVFNVDFIENNLRWKENDISSIILVGQESIEIDKVISELNEEKAKSVERLKGFEAELKKKEEFLSNGKTTEAKSIKTNLAIVEPFTAIHLSNKIDEMANDYEKFILDDIIYSNKLQALNLSKLGILKNIPEIIDLSSLIIKANELLPKVPELSGTMEYLKNNPKVAAWIESGLDIHNQKSECEFCGSALSDVKINNFKNHFSKDLQNFKSEIRILVQNFENSKILNKTILSSNQFYPDFRNDFDALYALYQEKIIEVNKFFNEIIDILKNKESNMYSAFPIITTLFDIAAINSIVIKLNDCISNNNNYSNEIEKNKKNVQVELIKHYCAQFVKTYKYHQAQNEMNELKSKHTDEQKLIKDIEKSISDNLAKIDNLENGREALNNQIFKLLGSNNLEIKVTKNNGRDYFSLYRNSILAKNLSEGEKTAISFAYFLVKLKEKGNISNTVVYIDDPISSLDHNHIFQINALIKSFFYKKVYTSSGEQHQLNCGQLIISTHNFDFFNLLYELPPKRERNKSFLLIEKVSDKVSKLTKLPDSLLKYQSEYHYLFSLLHQFHNDPTHFSNEKMLILPNAFRRVVELYTFSRLPGERHKTVDNRAEELFGEEDSKKILKIFHWHSHSNQINQMRQHTELLSPLKDAVSTFLYHLQQDSFHYNSLLLATRT